jgi:hypothetical protein
MPLYVYSSILITIISPYSSPVIIISCSGRVVDNSLSVLLLLRSKIIMFMMYFSILIAFLQ